MKRIVAMVLLLGAFATTAVQAENRYQYTFRGSWWGMTKDQVKKTELSKLDAANKDRDMLSYFGKINGFPCSILYQFKGGALVLGSYSIVAEHSNLNDWINDYKSFKEILEKKYGYPYIDGPRWVDTSKDLSIYRHYAKDPGLAISKNLMQLLSDWQTDTTEITLNLHSAVDKDGKPINGFALTILYQPNKNTGIKPVKLEEGAKLSEPEDF